MTKEGGKERKNFASALTFRVHPFTQAVIVFWNDVSGVAVRSYSDRSGWETS